MAQQTAFPHRDTHCTRRIRRTIAAATAAAAAAASTRARVTATTNATHPLDNDTDLCT
jgi:hypothetical protein